MPDGSRGAGRGPETGGCEPQFRNPFSVTQSSMTVFRQSTLERRPVYRVQWGRLSRLPRAWCRGLSATPGPTVLGRALASHGCSHGSTSRFRPETRGSTVAFRRPQFPPLRLRVGWHARAPTSEARVRQPCEWLTIGRSVNEASSRIRGLLCALLWFTRPRRQGPMGTQAHFRKDV